MQLKIQVTGDRLQQEPGHAALKTTLKQPNGAQFTQG